MLGNRIAEYTYVDFCAGAGGPTPYIEQHLNRRLTQSTSVTGSSSVNGEHTAVNFVLTDIAPHLDAWHEVGKRSDNMHFISTSVDAANAPTDLLQPFSNGGFSGKKVFRLFFLAFHHFDDPLATRIIRNTLVTSEGFGIFELQARTLSSLVTITLIWPLLLLVTPFYFWRSPGHIFFTYVIPIIPFVVVFDGYISSLRARTVDEIVQVIGKGKDMDEWEFKCGRECHTWPTGEMTWFVGLQKG